MHLKMISFAKSLVLLFAWSQGQLSRDDDGCIAAALALRVVASSTPRTPPKRDGSARPVRRATERSLENAHPNIGAGNFTRPSPLRSDAKPRRWAGDDLSGAPTSQPLPTRRIGSSSAPVVAVRSAPGRVAAYAGAPEAKVVPFPGEGPCARERSASGYARLSAERSVPSPRSQSIALAPPLSLGSSEELLLAELSSVREATDGALLRLHKEMCTMASSSDQEGLLETVSTVLLERQAAADKSLILKDLYRSEDSRRSSSSCRARCPSGQAAEVTRTCTLETRDMLGKLTHLTAGHSAEVDALKKSLEKTQHVLLP